MGDTPRSIEELANLTDCQITRLYLKPAARLAEERRRKIENLPPLPPENEKPLFADSSGKPVAPSLAFLVSMYRSMGCEEKLAIERSRQQIAAWKKLHGVD
jgi:hypothetical protein